MNELIEMDRGLRINGVPVGTEPVRPGDRMVIVRGSSGQTAGRVRTPLRTQAVMSGVRVWKDALGTALARIPPGTRIQLASAALAALVWLLTAGPLLYWLTQRLDDMDVRRAESLLSWLAADAQAAMERAGDVKRAADAVAQDRDVVSAVVLSDDGRVLAPAARATEVFRRIPVIDVPPAALVQLRLARAGNDLYLARPVTVGPDGRRAIAWLTMRRSGTTEDSTPLVFGAAALLLALGLATATAAAIRRATSDPLITLSRQLRSCLLGELRAVKSPFGGEQAGEHLVGTLNRLVARLRVVPGADPLATPNKESRT